MGNLAKDLREAKNTMRSNNQCTFGRLILTLDPEDQKALEVALNNEHLQTIAIYRALENNGIEIGYDVLARHRRRKNGGGCRCPIES